MYGKYEREEGIRNTLIETLTNNPMHFVPHNQIDEICEWHGIGTHENTWITMNRLNSTYFPRIGILGRIVAIQHESGVFYDPHPSERRVKIHGWRDGDSSVYPSDGPEQELFTLMRSVDEQFDITGYPKALKVISKTQYGLLLFFLKARLEGYNVTSKEILEQNIYTDTDSTLETMQVDRFRLRKILITETNGRWNIGKKHAPHGNTSTFSLEYTPIV
jgi:hypothetical protein